MRGVSVWQGTASAAQFPALDRDIDADVAIVGGGITGVTLAMLLAGEGRRVALVEGGRIGGGTTGNSTGNLYAVVDEGLRAVRTKWGHDVAAAVAASRRESVDFVEEQVRRLSIACDFARVPLYYYAVGAGDRDRVEREYEASSAVGLACRLEAGGPFAFASGPSLVLEHQAQFHPLAYVTAVARAIASDDCRLFEHTRAIEIDTRGHRVVTPRGTITAREVVLATHTPAGMFAVHAEMPVHQEYGVACRLAGSAYPQGIFWSAGGGPPSVRGMVRGDDRFLIVVGREHEPGRHDAVAAAHAVQESARAHFDVAEVAFGWAAQNFHAADMLPYIGRSIGSDVFIATGFATDGLTYGTLAARIIADELCGRANRWAGVYRARRFSPVKSARRAAGEAATVTRALMRDYVTERERIPVASLAPGRGALVDVDGEICAAFRDERGELTVVSSVCTHMKCRVHWNAVQRSWDCPCHGSRFAPDGTVLEGPALRPLARKDAPGQGQPSG